MDSPVSFVIVFSGRDGSSQLASTLNSHPSAICYPELFATITSELSQLEIIRGVRQQRDLRTLTRWVDEPGYFTGGYDEKLRCRPFSAVGLKTKLHYICCLDRILDEFISSSFKLIYLTRNLVAASVSIMNAQRLHKRFQKWNAQSAEETMGPLTLDINEFDEALNRRIESQTHLEEFYRNYPLDKLRITYEEIYCQNCKPNLSRILKFLDIDACDVSGGFVKNSPASLRDAILNYDTVKSFYVGTDVYKFFD